MAVDSLGRVSGGEIPDNYSKAHMSNITNGLADTIDYLNN